MDNALVTTNGAAIVPRPRTVQPETVMRYPTPLESFAGVEHLFIQFAQGRIMNLGQATEEAAAIETEAVRRAAIRQRREERHEAIRLAASSTSWRVVDGLGGREVEGELIEAIGG